ncbi:MAG: chromate efflux transporter [Anaerolineaceae bacterium]|jgi:chromate transporter|nr:chromate efflux transporter [Anaerolineaceae bacterium]MDD4042796.1 chromate efflux transporter [Anaerolineaceae bacterium]
MDDDEHIPEPDLQDESVPAAVQHVSEEVTKEPLKKRLLELFLTTLKIGLTSFGAPTAHVAMMEREFVRRKKWITEDHFLDLLAAANLIPGPNASETCYHVGYVRAGYPGLVVAGLGFISPSFLIALVVAWAYMTYGSLPQVEGIFYMLNPLVLAIVLETTWSIGKSSLVGWKQLLIFALAIGAKLLGVNEALILIGGGVVGVLLHHVLVKWDKGIPPGQMLLAFLPLPAVTEFAGRVLEQTKATFWNIFIYFFRTGSILFGSSLVLFALIEEDVVNRFGWLTIQQLTDAISMGQITPGPVLSASTFVGYIAGGFGGATAATLGVFLPSFLIVAATAPLVKKMRENHLTSSFLKGINPAVVALILFVSYSLAQNALVDVWTVLALVGGLAVLLFTQAQPYVLVGAGFVLGILRILIIT